MTLRAMTAVLVLYLLDMLIERCVAHGVFLLCVKQQKPGMYYGEYFYSGGSGAIFFSSIGEKP